MPDRQQLTATHHPALSERLFVWTELALSGLLLRLDRVRQRPR